MQRASKRVFVKTAVRWPVAGILLLCGCLYVCVCMCICVSACKAINNYWHDVV